MQQEEMPHITPREMKQYLDKMMSKKLAAKGLTPSNAPFILGMMKHPGLSMKEISDELGVDKSLTTRTMKTLIDDGFVENRSEEPHKYSLYLTKKGEDAAAVALAEVKQAWENLLRELTPEEVAEFRRICQKITDTIRKDLQ